MTTTNLDDEIVDAELLDDPELYAVILGQLDPDEPVIGTCQPLESINPAAARRWDRDWLEALAIVSALVLIEAVIAVIAEMTGNPMAGAMACIPPAVLAAHVYRRADT